jgi:hypothetical protein
MEEDKFLEYVAAYETWWIASEIFRDLSDRVKTGDAEAAKQLKIVVPILNALEKDYFDKKKHLDHLSMAEIMLISKRVKDYNINIE